MNPSGSSLARGVSCPASFALPQAPESTEASENGTKNHEAIEAGIASGDYSALPPVVGKLLDGATWVETEVAFAIDVEAEKVRRIGTKVGRKYGPLGAAEIALTVDAIIHRPGEFIVVDWKSRERVTSADRNLQIRAGCVASMKESGASKVLGAIAYLDDGEVDSCTVDAFDTTMFFSEMREMLRKIQDAKLVVDSGGTPAVHVSSECKYCPAVPYCPAQNALAKSMFGELASVEQQVAFLTNEQVGEAWLKLKQFMALGAKVEASLRLRARHGIVPLPNGKRLALVEKSRRSFDKDKALTRIKEAGLLADDLYKTTYFDQIAEVNIK